MKNKANMRSKDLWYVAAIIIAAIGFRLLLMSKMYAAGFDEINYLKLAAAARLHGISHVLHPYWTPLYPLAIAMFSIVVPDFELAGRLLSILLNSLLIVPIFIYVKAYAGRQLAYFVALLVAFYTMYARFSVYVETEALYIFLTVTGVFMGWNVLREQRAGRAIVVGMLFGGAYLTRPEGIGYLLVFLGTASLVFIALLVKHKKIMRMVLVMVLVTGGYIVVAFPYMNYLHESTGKWTLSAKGISNQLGEIYLRTKSPDEPHPFHVLRDNNTRLINDEIYHLGTFVSSLKSDKQIQSSVPVFTILKKIAMHNYQIMNKEFLRVLSLPILILVILGIFAVPWSRREIFFEGYLLLYVLFFWFVLIPAFHISVRYFIPLLPICFIWMAKGAEQFRKWLATLVDNSFNNSFMNRWSSRIGLIAALALILFGSILPEFAKHMKMSKYSTAEWDPCIEQKKAGLWLKKNGIKSPIIMAYNHAVSYYAGNYEIAESVEIPENNVDDLLEYARYRGVNYLVLNERYKKHHPLISHLYEGKDIPPDLKLIYRDKEVNGLHTYIYELVD